MKKILISGSTGYLGTNLVKYLSKNKKIKIKTLSRKYNNKFNMKVNQLTYNDFDKIYNYALLLNKIDIVIHLAAISNELKNTKQNTKKFHNFNIRFTMNLLKQISNFKVKKFIYFSTTKIYGEYNIDNKIYETTSPQKPMTNYSRSKYQSELLISKFCKLHKIEFVIIRMPMVYGEQENKNFSYLNSLIKLRIPLPLKNIKNKKSLLHIENFCHFMEKLIFFKNYNKEYIILSDDFSLSTSEIVNGLINKNKTSNYIFYFPFSKFKFLFFLFKLNRFYEKLFMSQYVSNRDAKINYNWRPKKNFNDYVLKN